MAYTQTKKNQFPVSLGVTYRNGVLKHGKAILVSLLFYILIFIVLFLKIITLKLIFGDFYFLTYSIAVSFYLLSRFALSYFYKPTEGTFAKEFEPSVSFAVPSKNEGEHIRETILRMVDSDYPKNKFDIIVVNDGSTDNTLEEMIIAKQIARRRGVFVEIVNWNINKGKREGMAECVKRSKKDIVMFVDSDSFVRRDSIRSIVKYFSIPTVGAVAGQAFVANAEKNFLTNMQSVRYYVAFKAFKSAEALFGSVTCCSGCLAAYRREAILPLIDDFANQHFLGVRCTYGDDRSLTNRLLKHGYDAVFAPDAIAYTFVPEDLKQYIRQQLRWKKSWLRESFMASKFMWKKNILMSISFYLGFLLPLFAPLIVLRAIFWYPLASGMLPIYYISGLLLMSIIYGLYYYRHTGDRNWLYGTMCTTLFTLVMFWQLPYALIKIRDSKWGTR